MYPPTRQKSDWHAKPTGAHNIVHNAHAFSSKVFHIFVGSSLMRIAFALNLCEVCVCVAFIAYLHCCEHDFKLANAFRIQLCERNQCAPFFGFYFLGKLFDFMIES